MEISNDEQIAILFLAYDGVAQAPLWEQWRGDSKAVLFFVHCDRTDPTMHPEFVSCYKLETAITTQWADTSLVQAVCTSMAEILKKHGQVQRIHLVSGHCVPVKPVSELIALPHETHWPFCDDKPRQITYQGHSFEFRKHSQFIHVNRADAIKLSSFQYLPVLQQYDAVRRKVASITAADEWLPWAILTFDCRTMPVVKFQPLTFVTWPDKRKSAHPLLWTSATRKQAIQFGPGDVQRMSLEQLWPSLQKNGYCFMRKVAMEAKIDNDMIDEAWEYILQI